ncbi:ferrous iron transport protein B [Candidatus Micrarchaeota archaeon]|nr:ferrous iron transport protein B [Candidatus Micrarchaeota archaeon]
MEKKGKMPTIALCGNPNTGKSTIFNALTGSSQKIGNWPGATVEKKWGKLLAKHSKGKGAAKIVDLPGTYSLSAYTKEELIARNFVVEDKPDVVIDVVDASNLERNLYLSVQLKELGANVVIALNMMDIARRRGYEIDVNGLSGLIGCPVVPLVADREEGLAELIEVSLLASEGKLASREISVNYGKDLGEEIGSLAEHVSRHAAPLAQKYGAHWVAVKILENDAEIMAKVNSQDRDICDEKLIEFVKEAEERLGEPVDIRIASLRYGFINGIVKSVLKKSPEERIIRSDSIDRLLINPLIGIPVFLLIMYAMFQGVFLLGAPLVELVEAFIGIVSVVAKGALEATNAPAWLSELVLVALIEGVGNVLIFLPNILLLFLGIAILEDTGYMARAAFVMNRIMQKIGLHGKSFISLVLGFGCSVPAVMAARTLKNEDDRLMTILVSPLVPCAARMEVFVFLAGAFFAPSVAGQAVFSLMLLSFVLIAVMGILFRKFLASGERQPFVMELPPYNMPTLKGLFFHMWGRAKMFVQKAGTFIFLVALIMWFLAGNPSGVEYGSAESYIGIAGRAIAPLFAPLGFGWEESVALLFGFLAKEVVISAFGILYGAVDEGLLTDTLAVVWTPLQAYVFMVFTLVYMPCFATVAVIRQETGSWKWAAFSAAYSCVLAWVVSLAVLTAGTLLGY